MKENKYCIVCNKTHQLHNPKSPAICINCCKHLAEIVEKESLRKSRILNHRHNHRGNSEP
jgi:hypothetical protein